MSDEPRFLLIVSDFHLSEGWDEETKRLSRREDFFFDTTFHRFLSKQAKIAHQQDRCLRLICAGDLVDFQQVIDTPEEFDGHPMDQRYQGLGLSTSPAHTCWKLEQIMTGHKIFFEALADFLLKGHDLFILPGNHDIEWVIPEVRNKFVEKMAELGPVGDKQKIRDGIKFRPWFYLEPGLVYVEHGNQYDQVDSFDYLLWPYLEDGRIDLPAGSFFVRYLFNHVELSWPFADNMKPATAFISWALRHWQGWRNLPKYIQFFCKTLEKAGPLSSEWEKELKQIHDERLDDLALDTPLPVEDLKKLKGHWAQSAIHHLSKWHLFWALLGRADKEAPLKEVAGEINQILKVRYVVFGHTHEADLVPMAVAETPGAEYVNSGTWTKVFSDQWEKRLLKEENEFAYVSIDLKKPRMELLRWRDDRDEGERVRLFHQPEERRKGEIALGAKALTLLFLVGALFVSVGDWFHIHTHTTSYPPEVYGWYVKGIPFFIPPIFGLTAVLLGIVYEQSRRLFGEACFRKGARVSHVIVAGLVYMALHAVSGYISHWSFPLPDIALAVPAFLAWYGLDRSRGGGLICLFAGLMGVSAEILLVHKGIFAFSDKADVIFGVPTWLPWIYMAGALAVGRFVERGLTYEARV